MKRETAIVFILVTFVVGYVWGRLGARSDAAKVAHVPVAAAPAPQAPAATPPAPPRPAPAVAKAPAPKPVASPKPATPPKAPASAGSTKPGSEQTWKLQIHGDDASKGPANAPVTVVVMSAFGCTPCIEFKPAVDQIIEEYGKKIRVVWKHKIFQAESPDALIASEASLAAKEQGKFWEYRDKLFDARYAIDRASLETYAKELKLNMKKFTKALDSRKHRGQVLRDSLLAFEVAAHSFPNVIANGGRMQKPKNYQSLKTLVDAELAKAEPLAKQGLKGPEIYERAIRNGKAFPQMGESVGRINTTSAAAMGPDRAKVEVVLFEDFQCPFCARVGPNFKEFQKRFPKDVRVVFKHMPLTSIHPDAQLASEAAVEAQKQGKFWEYHDVLFANLKSLTRPDLERYADQVGLDMNAFRQALDSGKHRAQVAADVNDGRRVGVSGTPSVYLNGRKYQGPRGYPADGLEAVSRTYFGLK